MGNKAVNRKNPHLQLAALKASIAERWSIIDWRQHFPWWQTPPNVRILLYADGNIRFDGGPFMGLQYVKTLLESRAYVYVDFDVHSAHRDGTDPDATIAGAVKLTDLNLIEDYDQIWFFGINKVPNLGAEELALIEQFMAAPKFGGVLVTGGHDDLGKGIAGQLPRAGAMRRYAVPPGAGAGAWNSELGASDLQASVHFLDPGFEQKFKALRYTRFPVWSPEVFKHRYCPHPVLSAQDGPVDVFPNHGRIGEALAPKPGFDDREWPVKDGQQESPHVIAWWQINDADSSRHGQEIGIVSAYDGHRVDVGRIVADSSWHHWFDSNLFALASLCHKEFEHNAGVSRNNWALLRKIDTYFLNCGVWLAPPVQQQAMNHALWWSIIWSDRFVEIPRDLPVWVYGQHALDALGRRVARCAVEAWLFESPAFKEKMQRRQWSGMLEQLQLVNLPVEQYLAGGIARRMLLELGPLNEANGFPQQAPSAEELESVIEQGISEGLTALCDQLRHEAALVLNLLEESYRG